MSESMVNLIAKKFIQRRDVKAIQTHSGAYVPVTDTGKMDGNRLPWTRADLEAHLAGSVSLGHYLIDQNNQTKLFAFDIDLEKMKIDANNNPIWWGSYPIFPDMTNYPGDPGGEDAYYQANTQLVGIDPRAAWKDRAHPARPWLKYQLRMVGEKLAQIVHRELELPTVMAYSGNKGIHVYAFCGPTDSHIAREAAEAVIGMTDEFEVFRGKNFWRHKNQDDVLGYKNLSIEIFPKQSSLEGKDLGNLMRVVLGRNLKSSDPTFFVDQRAPMNMIVPHPDPIALLESGNPWKD